MSLSFFEGCDLDDLRRQTFKSFLDFFVGQRFDPLFFGDFDLLIGVDIRLVRISKLQISLKECYETEYWLELMQRAGLTEANATARMLHTCGTIRRMLISSVNTAKKNETQT